MTLLEVIRVRNMSEQPRDGIPNQTKPSGSGSAPVQIRYQNARQSDINLNKMAAVVSMTKTNINEPLHFEANDGPAASLCKYLNYSNTKQNRYVVERFIDKNKGQIESMKEELERPWRIHK